MNTRKESKEMRVTKRVFLSFLIAALITGFLTGVCDAEKGKAKKTTKTVMNQITGELGFIGVNSISVIYEKKPEQGREYEMVLYLDENATVEYKKSLKEINLGDTIRIEYALITETTEKGEKTKRVAKKITFVRPKVTGLRSGNY